MSSSMENGGSDDDDGKELGLIMLYSSPLNSCS